MNLPEHEITFSYSKSSGPGGQNVNKNNTKVTLKWNIRDSEAYSEKVLDRIFDQNKNKVNKEGSLILSCQNYSNQRQNQEDCILKLKEIIEKALKEPKKRKKTKPTKSSIKKRLENKTKRSEKKSYRKKVQV